MREIENRKQNYRENSVRRLHYNECGPSQEQWHAIACTAPISRINPGIASRLPRRKSVKCLSPPYVNPEKSLGALELRATPVGPLEPRSALSKSKHFPIAISDIRICLQPKFALAHVPAGLSVANPHARHGLREALRDLEPLLTYVFLTFILTFG